MKAVSKEFVQYLNRSKTPLYEQIIYCEGTKDNVEVEVAMQSTMIPIQKIPMVL